MPEFSQCNDSYRLTQFHLTLAQLHLKSGSGLESVGELMGPLGGRATGSSCFGKVAWTMRERCYKSSRVAPMSSRAVVEQAGRHGEPLGYLSSHGSARPGFGGAPDRPGSLPSRGHFRGYTRRCGGQR